MKKNKIKKKILNKYNIVKKQMYLNEATYQENLIKFYGKSIATSVYVSNCNKTLDSVYLTMLPMVFSKNMVKNGNVFKGMLNIYKFFSLFKKLYRVNGLFIFYTLAFNFLVIVELRKFTRYSNKYKATTFLKHTELYLFRTAKFLMKAFGNRWLIGNSFTYDLFNQHFCLIFALKNSRLQKLSKQFSEEVYRGRKFSFFKW